MVDPRFSRPPQFNMNNANPGLIAGLIFGFLFITQCFVIIDPGKVGIVKTLGKLDDAVKTEGFNLKIPLIQQVIPVSIKQQTIEGKAPCFSSDLQTVDVSFKVLYRLPKEKVVELYRMYQGDPYYSLVEPRIQDSLKKVTAHYRAEDLVKNREKVRNQTLQLVRARLIDPESLTKQQIQKQQEFLEKFENTGSMEAIAPAEAPKVEKIAEAVTEGKDKGADKDSPAAKLPDVTTPEPVVPDPEYLVYIEDFPINNMDLSDELEQAIELKQIKEQEALAKSYELTKAKKDAEITVVAAKAEAEAVRIKGQALKSSPEVIELEISKKWDGKTPSTVVVGKGGGNVLLPLR